MQVTPELVNDPAAFAKFQAAQGQLTGALSRLMVVTENYPDLKSNQNFRDLQAQLEGTENRITVARNRYIESVQTYNTTIRQFPDNLTAKMFGYSPKPNFTVDNEAQICQAAECGFRLITCARAGRLASGHRSHGGAAGGRPRCAASLTSDGRAVCCWRPAVCCCSPHCSCAPMLRYRR